MSSQEGYLLLLPPCPDGHVDIVFVSSKHERMPQELVDQTNNFQKARDLQHELDRIENVIRARQGLTSTVNFSSSSQAFVAYCKMLLDACQNAAVEVGNYLSWFADSVSEESDPITKMQLTIMKERDELLQELADTPCFVRVPESDFAEENA